MKAQFVSENISFQRGGNPLGTMDLGGFSFETLRPGAILRSKRYFGVSKSTGNIGGYNSSSIRIGKGDWLLVTDVREQDGGKKNISWRRYHYSREEYVYEQREKLKESGTRGMAWYGITSGFFDNLTKRRFDYRLEIMEPGFPITESIRFQSGDDPKRAMGIGERTWSNLRPGDILIPKQPFKITRYGTFKPPSSKGNIYFDEEYPLVVLKIRQGAVESSSGSSSRIVNGYVIHYIIAWDITDAKEISSQIQNGTYEEPKNLRRPIQASERALEKRLEIYEG